MTWGCSEGWSRRLGASPVVSAAAVAGLVVAGLVAAGLVVAPGAARAQSNDVEADQRAMEQAAAEDDAARAAEVAAEKEEEDEGRPVGWKKFFWVDAFAGYSFANLEALDYQDLVPERVQRSGSGFTTGAGLGFRIFFLTLGARYAYATYPEFDLSSVVGEVGIRIPTPMVEPFLRVGLGYGWLDADFGAIDPDIDGLVADVGAGFDVWVHRFVTVGLAFQTAFYLLARDAVDACLEGRCDFEEFGDDGDAAAIQARVELHVTLHL